MPYVIETDSITKRFGSKEAVKNVSMHVERGEIYGLIGKNGAGKTTLMKLILGLNFANEGNIKLFESEKVDEGRARIGSLIEAPGIYSSESAFSNMKRFALLCGSGDDEIQRLLDLVGLGDVGNKKAGAFSLGMKQRLGIAIALLGDPEVLVLDEPVNGLDPAGIKDVRDIILKLNAEGVTVLISSHLLDELGKIATKFGIMRDGELVEELTREQINNLCRAPLEIIVSEPEAALVFIECNYFKSGADDKLKLIDGKIFVYDYDISPAEINSKLVSAGFSVSELKRENVMLEDFFIKRMG